MNRLLFVYGTLRRGRSNHGQLAGQQFLGAARTVPGYRLHDLGGYPGLALDPASPDGVCGEVWAVDPMALARLDAFEGVAEGLYRRALLPLAPPFERAIVEAYVPVADVADRPVIGSSWRDPKPGAAAGAHRPPPPAPTPPPPPRTSRAPESPSMPGT
jgi:gamma-glutamylaminecyclotransferase